MSNFVHCFVPLKLIRKVEKKVNRHALTFEIKMVYDPGVQGRGAEERRKNIKDHKARRVVWGRH